MARSIVSYGLHAPSTQAEGLLEAACHYVQRTVSCLWNRGDGPSLLGSEEKWEQAAECNVTSLETWLRALDARVTQMHDSSQVINILLLYILM